ncbi:MAG: elongation factor P [Candidatus Riflebacteria bacterium]|nr:elongation factor P [Candidatus Riflebacteria bacterium]
MSIIGPNEIRKGIKLEIDGQLFVVTDFKHIAPGNWRAMVETTMKSLKTGQVLKKTFRMSDQLTRAEVTEQKMNYLYKDADGYHFMDNTSYEQFVVSEELIGDVKFYIKEEDECTVQIHEGIAIGVEGPMFVTLEVTDTQPQVKGATASSSYKPATLSTGLQVKVPPFINIGDKIKVDTRTNEYVERAK